jgi:broad specificity phosphatase PhoE
MNLWLNETMRIILVRHGETLWNREHRCQGKTDTDLTLLGLKQAEELAQRLGQEQLAAVYSSPLKRARQTAQLIAQLHRLPVEIRAGLREMDQGGLEGKTFVELREEYGEFMERWREDPAGVRLPGGESLDELQQRAWAEIERIRQEHPQGQVVVVGHQMAIITIICRFLDISLTHFRRLRQDLASLSILEYGERGPALVRLNETNHLDKTVADDPKMEAEATNGTG